MKRFRFSLEAVQTVRERAAQEALENYGRAVRERAASEARWAAAEAALTDHLSEWRKAMKGGFSPREMLQNEHARTMLEAHRDARAEELRVAAAAVARAQAEFQVARQNSEVVERFHDRQRRAFNLSALKEEQNILDEMALTRRHAGMFEKGFADA